MNGAVGNLSYLSLGECISVGYIFMVRRGKWGPRSKAPFLVLLGAGNIGLELNEMRDSDAHTGSSPFFI